MRKYKKKQKKGEIKKNEYIFDNNLQHNYFAYIHDRNGNILDSLEVEIADEFYKYEVRKASGDEGNSKDSKTSTNDGDAGSSNNGDNGASEVQGDSNNHGNSAGRDSSGSHVVNSDKSGNYGTNSSDIPSQDTSDNGEDALSNGDVLGKGTGHGGHTHFLPDSSKSTTTIDYSNFDTENGGNVYDIEGRNDIGGRKKLTSFSLYNKDYQYGAHLIDTEENQRNGQYRND